jgi:hypothetical protein
MKYHLQFDRLSLRTTVSENPSPLLFFLTGMQILALEYYVGVHACVGMAPIGYVPVLVVSPHIYIHPLKSYQSPVPITINSY